MSMNDDQTLLETVQTHRQRLLSAFLHGSLGVRRAVRSPMRRLIVGVIIAAVASAACGGVGFVTKMLADQAASQVETVPTPEPTEG